MSKIKALLALNMMAMSLATTKNRRPNYMYEPPESEMERKNRLDKAEINRYLKQGLKKFDYEKGSVYAINKKVADKKAKKKGYL